MGCHTQLEHRCQQSYHGAKIFLAIPFFIDKFDSGVYYYPFILYIKCLMSLISFPGSLPVLEGPGIGLLQRLPIVLSCSSSKFT